MGVKLEVRLDTSDEAPLVYELDQSRVALGRAPSADVRLPHAAVSATHATLRVHNAGYAAFDEGSTNGTFVGDARLVVGRPKPLRTGDVIRIGPYVIVVRVGLAIGRATSSDGTAAHARALLARAEGDRPRSITIVNGPSAGRIISIPPAPAELVLGRGEHVDVHLEDVDCSREHAALVVDDAGILLVDRESKNGLVVNGRAVRERRLQDRDELLVGATRLVFEDPLAASLRALEGVPDEPHVPPPKPAPVATAPTAEASPGGAEDAPEVMAVIDEAPPPKKKPSSEGRRPFVERRREGMTDGLVYMLAGAVLALSLVGIYLLVAGS